MSIPNPYTATLPDEISPETGALLHDVTGTPTVLGITRGGLKATPSMDIKSLDFDGNYAEFIEGLLKFGKRGLRVSGKMLQVGPNQFKVYEAGSTSAVVTGPPSVTTITPADSGTLLAAGAYLDNFTFALPLGDGSTQDIVCPKAIVLKWDLQTTDENGSEVDIEIAAVLAATTAATSTKKVPYKIVHTAAA